MFYVFAGTFEDSKDNYGWKALRSAFYHEEAAIFLAKHMIDKAGLDWCHVVDEEEQMIIWDSSEYNKDDV